MLRNTFRTCVFSGLAAIFLSGCGSDAETAESQAEATPATTVDLFAPIPPEELYGASPVENLWSPRVELEVRDLPVGWNGTRIAILSDLQLGLWDGNEEVASAAVQRAVDAQTELIVLLGDFLAEGGEAAALERVLTPLRGRNALAVLGDRDVRTDSIATVVVSVLRSAGVQVLRNSTVAVVLRGDTAWLAGADPELLSMPGADQAWILATMGRPGRTPVLLTHSPAVAARVPENRYPVILAGNTFCGQVEVAGSPRLQWLREQVFPGGLVEGVDRLFRVENSTLLVSCGVGYGFVPLRFGAPPEVPILTLVRLGGMPQPVAEGPGIVADSLIERFQEEAATRDTL